MARFIQLPGGTLLLPDYARPDLAVTQSVNWKKGGNSTTWSYTPSGAYLYVLASIFFQFQASAITGLRVPNLSVITADGVTRNIWPANPGVLAGQTAYYNFTTGLTDYKASRSAGIYQYATCPLPLETIQAGYQWLWQCDNGKASDVFQILATDVVLIPTGPELAAAAATIPLAPTPMLV